jgi:Flp pilus assembly protein TadG
MTKPSSKHQRGAALVEFALCASLLLLLLFGILDVGLLLGDRASLGAAAREGARALAVGDTPSDATNRAIAVSGLPLTSANVALTESIPDANGNPTVWVTVGTNAGQNDATSGDFVCATVTYDHPLITSLVFTGGTKTLTASLMMRRE